MHRAWGHWPLHSPIPMEVSLEDVALALKPQVRLEGAAERASQKN